MLQVFGGLVAAEVADRGLLALDAGLQRLPLWLHATGDIDTVDAEFGEPPFERQASVVTTAGRLDEAGAAAGGDPDPHAVADEEIRFRSDGFARSRRKFLAGEHDGSIGFHQLDPRCDRIERCLGAVMLPLQACERGEIVRRDGGQVVKLAAEICQFDTKGGDVVASTCEAHAVYPQPFELLAERVEHGLVGQCCLMRLRLVHPPQGQLESCHRRLLALLGRGEPVCGWPEAFLGLADDPLTFDDLAVCILEGLQIPGGIVGANLMRTERERES